MKKDGYLRRIADDAGISSGGGHDALPFLDLPWSGDGGGPHLRRGPGLRFLAGGIEKIIHSQVNFLFSLYALGALLSYTAVLCSIPTKEEKDHE